MRYSTSFLGTYSTDLAYIEPAVVKSVPAPASTNALKVASSEQTRVYAALAYNPAEVPQVTSTRY